MISTKIRYKQYSNTTGVISSIRAFPGCSRASPGGLGLSRELFSMTPQWISVSFGTSRNFSSKRPIQATWKF